MEPKNPRATPSPRHEGPTDTSREAQGGGAFLLGGIG